MSKAILVISVLLFLFGGVGSFPHYVTSGFTENVSQAQLYTWSLWATAGMAILLVLAMLRTPWKLAALLPGFTAFYALNHLMPGGVAPSVQAFPYILLLASAGLAVAAEGEKGEGNRQTGRANQDRTAPRR